MHLGGMQKVPPCLPSLRIAGGERGKARDIIKPPLKNELGRLWDADRQPQRVVREEAQRSLGAAGNVVIIRTPIPPGPRIRWYSFRGYDGIH